MTLAGRGEAYPETKWPKKVEILQKQQNLVLYAYIMQNTLFASQLEVPEQDKNIFTCIEQVPDDLERRKTQ